MYICIYIYINIYIYIYICNYIKLYYYNILSKYQCGFKGHNSQHCLITMTKKFRKRLNRVMLFPRFVN